MLANLFRVAARIRQRGPKLVKSDLFPKGVPSPKNLDLLVTFIRENKPCGARTVLLSNWKTQTHVKTPWCTLLQCFWSTFSTNFVVVLDLFGINFSFTMSDATGNFSRICQIKRDSLAKNFCFHITLTLHCPVIGSPENCCHKVQTGNFILIESKSALFVTKKIPLLLRNVLCKWHLVLF